MGAIQHSITLIVLQVLLILQLNIDSCIGKDNATDNPSVNKTFFEDSSNPALKTCCEFQNSFVNGTCHANGNDSWESFSMFGIELRSYSYVQKYSRINASMESNSEIAFLRLDGNLEVNGIIYLYNTYCIDSMEVENNTSKYIWMPNIVFFIPEQNALLEMRPLSKCCRWDEIAGRLDPFECFYNDFIEINFKNITRKLYQHHYADNHTGIFDETTVHTDHWPKGCKRSEMNTRQDSDFRITEFGTAEIAYDFFWIEIDNYCLEIYATKSTTEDSIMTDVAILYCPSEVASKIEHLWKIPLIYCTISWIFILLTLVVYLILWKKHSLHGWIQFAFLLSAFCYFFMKFIRTLLDIAYNFHVHSWVPELLESFFAFGLHTNLVNLNCSMLWKLIVMRPNLAIWNSKDLNKVCISVTACWMLSAVISLAEWNMSFDAVMQLRKYALRTLLVVNIAIFFATGFVLCYQIKLTRTYITSASFGLPIFLKLFLITGMTWSLPWIFEIFFFNTKGWNWHAVEFLTNTYGIVVFVAFVMNRRFLKGLKEKFSNLFARFSGSAKLGRENILLSTYYPNFLKNNITERY